MTKPAAIDLDVSRPSSLLWRGALDLIRRPLHHPGMDRRRFLLTSLAGAVGASLGAEALVRLADELATARVASRLAEFGILERRASLNS
jgi:hypothetical protein